MDKIDFRLCNTETTKETPDYVWIRDAYDIDWSGGVHIVYLYSISPFIT